MEKDSLAGDSKYIVAKHTGTGTRAFSKTARGEIWPSKKHPGPGHYEKPSDFGVYGDAKYYKTLSSFSAK